MSIEKNVQIVKDQVLAKEAKEMFESLIPRGKMGQNYRSTDISRLTFLCRLQQRVRLANQAVPQSESGGARSAAAQALTKTICRCEDVVRSYGEEGDGFESFFAWFERV